MVAYRAHYRSPGGENPRSGEFVFESEHPLNSRANIQDARFKLLDLFGSEAVSWQITSTEKGPSSPAAENVCQPALDFREPKKIRHKRKFERGKI